MPKHVFIKHKNCVIAHCPICEGGLAECSICGCFEGSLTTECSERLTSMSTQEMIFSGLIDFKDGHWLSKTNKF